MRRFTVPFAAGPGARPGFGAPSPGVVGQPVPTQQLVATISDASPRSVPGRVSLVGLDQACSQDGLYARSVTSPRPSAHRSYWEVDGNRSE